MNVLVTGARAPIAADIAKALTLSGYQVWVADSLRAPLAASSPFVRGLVRLPGPREDFRAFYKQLAAACVEFSIEAIVPTSEEIFWLAGARPFLPTSVNVRTSTLLLLAQLHHKGTFARLAVGLGYGAPENHEIDDRIQIAQLGDPARWVFKPVYSRFATQTLIAPTTRQVDRLRPSRENPWLAQTRVTGRELCAYNVAQSGRLVLHVAYEPMIRFGVGASVYFSPVISEPLREMSERFISATNFTGQISFDVMETASGLVALECNPRGTSGVHLAAQRPEILAAALLGQLKKPEPVFLPDPRLLLLPLLLNHPGTIFHSRGRGLLRAGKDALSAAGIPLAGQAKALAEMAWRAARTGVGISRASTADIEWNGETMHG